MSRKVIRVSKFSSVEYGKMQGGVSSRNIEKKGGVLSLERAA